MRSRRKSSRKPARTVPARRARPMEPASKPRFDQNSDEARCPFCGKDPSCSHVLLVADISFGEFVRGRLCKAAEKKWCEVRDKQPEQPADPDDEFRPLTLDDFLDDVASISDTSGYHECDVHAGLSGRRRYFFCKDRESMSRAVARFTGKPRRKRAGNRNRGRKSSSGGVARAAKSRRPRAR